jgi:hypothetical protein
MSLCPPASRAQACAHRVEHSGVPRVEHSGVPRAETKGVPRAKPRGTYIHRLFVSASLDEQFLSEAEELTPAWFSSAVEKRPPLSMRGIS